MAIRPPSAVRALGGSGGWIADSRAVWLAGGRGMVAVLTADAGTINTGLIAVSEPERRGAFLAVQAVSGFGASAVTPMLFELILDLAGGTGSEAAWITAFAAQELVTAAWPFRLYPQRRSRPARRAVARRVIPGNSIVAQRRHSA